MRMIALTLILLFTSSSFAKICQSCKTMNQMIQDVQLERDNDEAAAKFFKLCQFIEKLKMSPDRETMQKQYKTIFLAVEKTEKYDYDFEIPAILIEFYRKDKSNFVSSLQLLPKSTQQVIMQKMKTINVVIEFGESKITEQYLDSNPNPSTSTTAEKESR